MMAASEIRERYLAADNPAGQVMYLAQQNRCRPSDIAVILREGGIDLPDDFRDAERERRGRVFSPELDGKIVELYAAGLLPSAIAEQVGLEAKQIRNRLTYLKKRKAEPKAEPAGETPPEMAEMLGLMLHLLDIVRDELHADRLLVCSANEDKASASVLYEVGGSRYRLRLEGLA